MTTIDLRREGEYRRETYGVLLTSTTQHWLTGRGIHNPHHQHSLDVWENKMRDDYVGQVEAYRDPNGDHTSSRYSFLLSPHANVITSQVGREVAPVGDSFGLGDIVNLTIEGFSIGWFQVAAKALHDPHLVPVDISTNASRQFYIDTGEYLERDFAD